MLLKSSLKVQYVCWGGWMGLRPRPPPFCVKSAQQPLRPVIPVSTTRLCPSLQVVTSQAAQLCVFILGMQYLHLGVLRCVFGVRYAVSVLVTSILPIWKTCAAVSVWCLNCLLSTHGRWTGCPWKSSQVTGSNIHLGAIHFFSDADPWDRGVDFAPQLPWHCF